MVTVPLSDHKTLYIKSSHRFPGSSHSSLSFRSTRRVQKAHSAQRSPKKSSSCIAQSCNTLRNTQQQSGDPQQSTVHRQSLKSLGRLAACTIALIAWGKLSAARPGSLFCSTTAATSGSTGGLAIRSVGSSAWAGLAAGCLHSLSGPDHLAALTPLTLGISSVKASLLGAWWGFGHCIGQLILGLAMLLLKDRFHSFVPMLDKYSALTIGLTLITIGGLGLYETLAESPSKVETNTEIPPTMQTAGAPSVPLPVEPPGTSAEELRELSGVEPKEKQGKGFSVWTLATGIIYGLQPDALFVVIPALALPTKLAAAAYMAMFVTGTVLAMGSYTAFIGATSKAIRSRGRWFKVENLSGVASLIALLMGLAVVFGWSTSFSFFGGAHT